MDDQVMGDPLAELAAMQTVHGALVALSPDGRARVLDWVAGALSVSTTPKTVRRSSSTDTSTNAQQDEDRSGDGGATGTVYTQFADLLGDARPKTDADKALVGGYWFQVVSRTEDFGSQAVNDKLKDTGEAVGNITRAMDRLRDSKPQLVRQIQKTGKAQQARKKFKLTTAGIQYVERMLAQGD